jgi:hypothetical protein
VTSYSDTAYSDDEIAAALKAAGYVGDAGDALKRCVAESTTAGKTLTDLAESLGLSAPRFWAYYQQWCRDHAEPLRLGDDNDE